MGGSSGSTRSYADRLKLDPYSGAAYPNLAPHSSLTGRRGVAFRVMACTLVRWAVAVGTLCPVLPTHSTRLLRTSASYINKAPTCTHQPRLASPCPRRRVLWPHLTR